MSSVEEVCEEFALINHSRVVLSGSVAQVRRNFGKKLYRVGVSDTMALEPVEGLYCVEHVEPSPFGGIVADLRLDADALPHDVIAYINDHYKLAEFHELLPSMNEIFIETVSNTTNTAAQ